MRAYIVGCTTYRSRKTGKEDFVSRAIFVESRNPLTMNFATLWGQKCVPGESVDIEYSPTGRVIEVTNPTPCPELEDFLTAI